MNESADDVVFPNCAIPITTSFKQVKSFSLGCSSEPGYYGAGDSIPGYGAISMRDPDECAIKCASVPGCVGWTFSLQNKDESVIFFDHDYRILKNIKHWQYCVFQYCFSGSSETYAGWWKQTRTKRRQKTQKQIFGWGDLLATVSIALLCGWLLAFWTLHNILSSPSPQKNHGKLITQQ